MKNDDSADKPFYRAIERYNKTEIGKIIEENDLDMLPLVILSVALYSNDYEYAENFCVRFSNHENFAVRANAIQGFGHIARMDRKSNKELIKPIIKKALKDENEYVRGSALDTIDDTKHLLKWKY
jgi:HEAT repeat protein